MIYELEYKENIVKIDSHWKKIELNLNKVE